MGGLTSAPVEEDVYYLIFTNAFIAWTCYQNRRSDHVGPGDYWTASELKANFDRAIEILS